MIFLEKRSYLVMRFSISVCACASVCVNVWMCGLMNLAKSLIHTHAPLALSRLSVCVCVFVIYSCHLSGWQSRVCVSPHSKFNEVSEPENFTTFLPLPCHTCLPACDRLRACQCPIGNAAHAPKMPSHCGNWLIVAFFFFLVFPFANLQSQIKTISIFSAPINDRRGRGRERELGM